MWMNSIPWNEIMWWGAVSIAIYLMLRLFQNVDRAAKTLRDDQLEGLIAAHHLQKDHFYLFVWDMRTISQARANDLRNMLHARGIDSGCMRMRPGTPPICYDLKRPEDPVKGI